MYALLLAKVHLVNDPCSLKFWLFVMRQASLKASEAVPWSVYVMLELLCRRSAVLHMVQPSTADAGYSLPFFRAVVAARPSYEIELLVGPPEGVWPHKHVRSLSDVSSRTLD